MSGPTIRVALLGKTGFGKSSLCNTLFGQDVFETDDSANSGSEKCQAETRDVDGRRLTLIDTPGFFDTDAPEELLKDEMVKCITECAPGPHAFLILLKVERFTPQEKEVIEKIRQTFSEEAFKYAVIVFTHGDQLHEGVEIKTFVQKNAGLRELVSRCGGRCHVFDNKYWKNNKQDEYRSNQFQRGELLTTIEKMVKENGEGCYTNDMLQQVETIIQKEEERIQQTEKGIKMSLEVIREQTKKALYQALKMCADANTTMLLGALLGRPTWVSKAVSWFREVTGNPTVRQFLITYLKRALDELEKTESAAERAPAPRVVQDDGEA